MNNDIKSAYDALVAAIREETGVNPDIAISFHGQGKNAQDVADKILAALGTPKSEYKKSNGTEWFIGRNSGVDVTAFV